MQTVTYNDSNALAFFGEQIIAHAGNVASQIMYAFIHVCIIFAKLAI